MKLLRNQNFPEISCHYRRARVWKWASWHVVDAQLVVESTSAKKCTAYKTIL